MDYGKPLSPDVNLKASDLFVSLGGGVGDPVGCATEGVALTTDTGMPLFS
jgi:hypothetical protein